jgi:hypothetical protein
MADQAGHIAIGMLFVLIAWSLGELLRLQLNRELGAWPSFAGFVVLFAWATYKEHKDYSEASAKIGDVFDSTRDRKDLLQNAAIAVYYMCLGGVIALSTLFASVMLNRLSYPLPVLIFLFVAMFIGLVVLIIAPAFFYWLEQKIRFQQIGLPFLFRLPEFRHPELKGEVASKIDQFIENSGNGLGKHIAIVGTLNSGKTTLAVGIATESSFRGKKACYLTFDKLQQIVASGQEPKAPRNTLLWPWKHSQILIIDDVTAGIPNSDAEHPEQLARELKVLRPNALDAIKERNTVWCLGADLSEADKWIDTLKNVCGIAGEDLTIVRLRDQTVTSLMAGLAHNETRN